MKKFICLLLAFAFIFSLCACGKGEGETPKGEIDKTASKGEIPEYPIKLGSTPDEIIAHYNERAEAEQNPDLIIGELEGQTAVQLTNGVQTFYYEKEHKDKGVSVFVVQGDSAFGYELGTNITKTEVISRLAADYTISEATAEQLYFLPGTVEGAEILSCSFDKIRLDFFFFDGILSAVSLTNTEYWTD